MKFILNKNKILDNLSTIKFRLNSLFVFILILMGFILIIFLWYNHQKNKLHQLEITLKELNMLLNKASNDISNFQLNDGINIDFHKEGKSEFLDDFNKTYPEILGKLYTLKQEQIIKDSSIENSIIRVEYNVIRFKQDFDTLIHYYREYGFKNFGLSGKMRESIHGIEQSKYATDMVTILMLRRHEKDYMLRKQEEYVKKLNKLCIEFEETIRKKNFNNNESNVLLESLNQYRITFNKMVVLDQKIGIDIKNGKRFSINQDLKEIEKELGNLFEKITSYVNISSNKIIITIVALMLAIIITILLLSMLVANKISIPINKLSTSIRDIVDSDFKTKISFNYQESRSEIGRLSEDFVMLVNKVYEQTTHLKKQHESLLIKNDEINKINTNLEEIVLERTMEIEKQKEELLNSNEILTQKQDDIFNSLQYASRIQNALLPSQEFLQNYFSEIFIIYKPKDIVSGDFYWCKTIDNQIIVAVADCTGHGVPGAFMSLLGISYLNEITYNFSHLNANEILGKLRQRIKSSLNQYDNQRENKDGMDIALCIINQQNYKLQYSGANSPLYIFRNNELIEIKPDKMPIGVFVRDKENFTNNILDIQPKDTIYMFSDGFSDQFGGDNNRKFLSKNLKNTLTAISHQTLVKQEEILNQTFEKWKGDRPQLDDVLVAGFRIS